MKCHAKTSKFTCFISTQLYLALLYELTLGRLCYAILLYSHRVHGQIKFPNVDRIGYVTCGADSSLAITEDGNTIYAWGRGYTSISNPEPIGFRLFDPVTQVRTNKV